MSRVKTVKKTSDWWWIGRNHYTSNSSSWLNSTLSELDAKTNEIVRLIDEVDDEADSFVKRAKVFYEKKPKLIDMVEDLYRSHRSLAYKYDLLVKNSSLDPYRHNSSTCDEELSELCEETESEVNEDQIVELERLREENRVYKEIMREKREVTSLFTNSIIRIWFCVFFASIFVGIYFVFSFCVFVYYLLKILFEVGCFLY